MIKKQKTKNQGYALITVLIFFTVLLVIGLGLGYVVQKNYLSVSAEAKFAKAEKLANTGLLTVVSNGTCVDYFTNGIKVVARKDSNHKNCIIWSEGTYQGAKVVKTAVFPLLASNWGAVIFKKISNLSGLSGSAALIGYDSPENNCTDPTSCIAPALVTGNQINPGNLVIVCNTNPNNLGSGLISTIDPYKYNPNLINTDMTDMLFDSKDRIAMLAKLSETFKVQLNNGKPEGIVNPDLSTLQLGNINNCYASSNTINCDNNKIFTWNGTHYIYNGHGYQAIDFGQNAQIIIQETFIGGGTIAGNNIKIQGNTFPMFLTLVARNQIDLTTNNINIANTFMFAQNYNIDAKRMTIENGIIYSGGAGVGNLNIDLNAQTEIGTQDNPVLIITDNNINIQRNGNSEIWGVIFATETNNNFNLGSGNGDFKIHGAVVSNSLNNNNINLSGNFEIRFNYRTIEKIYQNFSGLGLNFLKTPVCGSSKSKLFKLTGTRVY